MAKKNLVVVVDDDFSVLSVMKDILFDITKNDIMLFSHPLRAYEAVVKRKKEYQHIHIITDYNMGSMKGTELIRLLKENVFTPSVQYILMSGENKKELASLLEVDFLQKPISIESIEKFF